MAPAFEPCCQPVARRGLPHSNPARAMAALRRTTPHVLTWYGLPNRALHEYLFVQSAYGFPGLVIGDTVHDVYVEEATAQARLTQLALAYLQAKRAAGNLPLTTALGLRDILGTPRQQAHYPVIVSQVLGPVSLALVLPDEHGRPLVYNSELREALAHHLALRVQWLAHELAPHCTHQIVCLDEPLLALLNSPFCPLDWDEGLDLIEQTLYGLQVSYRGLLVGEVGIPDPDQPAGFDWRLLLQRQVNMLQLDLHHHRHMVARVAPALADLIQQQGIVAWGLVPADAALLGTLTVDDLVRRFEASMQPLVNHGVTLEAIARASLISTSGNLVHLSEAAAEHALSICAAVSGALQHRYGYATEHRPTAPPAPAMPTSTSVPNQPPANTH